MSNYANDSVLFTDIESSLRLCKYYIEYDITFNKNISIQEYFKVKVNQDQVTVRDSSNES